MQWGSLPLWELQRLGNEGSTYAVKVNSTAVDTFVCETHKDDNVRIDIHETGGGRRVGYVVYGISRGRKPLRLVRPSCLGLFYTNTRAIQPSVRSLLSLIYYDSYVRFLAFGEGRQKDYMLVLRIRHQDR